MLSLWATASSTFATTPTQYEDIETRQLQENGVPDVSNFIIRAYQSCMNELRVFKQDNH